MRLPQLYSNIPKNEQIIGAFAGLDEKLVMSEGEFSELKNVSDRFYPAISTREPRGEVSATIEKPNGLYYKNHLFYVDGTKCYYNGEEVSGLTVTDGEKQLVGMGAYICIFPDKKIFNTATGEITEVNASYTQSGTITFKELSTDSVYTKITATGIGNTFKAHDGVKIEGVNDASFLIDGEPVTNVITEMDTNYIVVTASIQNTFSGAFEMSASGSNTLLSATGIGADFKANDIVKIIGSMDDALNVKDKNVVSRTDNQVVISGAFPSKTFTQGGALTIEPYYSGSDKTKISGTNLNTIFAEGDVVTISGCSVSAVNGSHEIVQAGNDYILINVTLTSKTTQNSGMTITRTKHKIANGILKRTGFTRSSGITFSRESQDFDYVCEHNNRLWACNSLNHEIYASKLGDPTNWNCYEGISTDSYTVTVGSDGVFTGCVSHMGYVLFFKEQSIHIMYGSKPANFQLNTTIAPGVREGCSKSLVVVNETLFYVARNGVYSYDGAIPQKVSDNILSDISDAVCSQQDNRYYMSCLKDGERALLVYDPQYRIWDVEDDTEFKFAAYGDGKLHFIDGDNNLTTITGNRDELIWWSMDSGDIIASTLNEKYITRIKFYFLLEEGAEANIYIRYDMDPIWHRQGTIYSTTKKTYTIPIMAQRCYKFRWKIEGKGQIKVIACGYTVEGGSELNGTIQSQFRR